ncbi:OadG family protein [Chloroflexota bacterium]
MAVDWGLAGRIGGMGFGMVFAVLIILAVAIWLTGLVISKVSSSEDETSNSKKGA